MSADRIYRLCNSADWATLLRELPQATRDQVNYAGPYQFTPLHWAIKDNAPLEVVKLLIDKGADVNAVETKSQYTPLHDAANNKAPLEVVKLLIDKGANVNALTSYGQTPLIRCAINGGSAEVATLLLENGADPNVKDKNGKLASDYARETNNQAVASVLSKGVAPKPVSKQDSKAKSHNTTTMQRVIEKAGVEASRAASIVKTLVDDEVDLALLVTLDLAALKAMGIVIGDADKILRSAKLVIASELAEAKNELEALTLEVTQLDQTAQKITNECQTSQTEMDRVKQQMDVIKTQMDEFQAKWTDIKTQRDAKERLLSAKQKSKAEKAAELDNVKQRLKSLETAMAKSGNTFPPLGGAVKTLTEDRDFERAVAQSLSVVQADLQRALDSERDLSECRICCERRISQSFQCGHLFCQECADRILGTSRKCPSCRVQVVNVIPIYF